MVDLRPDRAVSLRRTLEYSCQFIFKIVDKQIPDPRIARQNGSRSTRSRQLKSKEFLKIEQTLLSHRSLNV